MRSVVQNARLIAASFGVGLAAVPATRAQVATAPSTSAVAPQPTGASKVGDWIETDERLNRRLLNSLLADGNAGVAFQPRELSPAHTRFTAVYTNGINTSLDALSSFTQDLADRVRLPIIPVYNESGVWRNRDWTQQNLKLPLEHVFGPVFPSPGIFPLTPPSGLREQTGSLVGRGFDAADSGAGILEDLLDSSRGRFVSARVNGERATDTLVQLMKSVVEQDKNLLLFAHSQGAINAANATKRYQSELEERVRKGELTKVQASTYLANIAVISAGSPMPKDQFANGVRVLTNRNPGDPVAKLSFEEPLNFSQLALEEHGFERYIEAVSADARELMTQLSRSATTGEPAPLSKEAQQIKKDLSILRAPELKALRERLLEYSRTIEQGENSGKRQAALNAATNELIRQLEKQQPEAALKTASAVERILRLVGTPRAAQAVPNPKAPSAKTTGAEGDKVASTSNQGAELTPEQSEKILAAITNKSGAVQDELIKKSRQLEQGDISPENFATYAKTASEALDTASQTAGAVAQIVGYFDPRTAQKIDRVALGLRGGAELALGLARVFSDDFTGIGGIASGVADIFSSIFGGGDHGPSIEELIYQRQGTIIENQRIILQAVTQNADLIRMVSRQIENLSGHMDNKFDALKDNLNGLRADIARDLGNLDARIHIMQVDMYREMVEQARFRNRFERLERRSAVLELPKLGAEAGLNLPDYRTALRISFNQRAIDPKTGRPRELENAEKVRSDLIEHIVDYSGRGFFSGRGFNIADIIQYAGRSQGPLDDRLIIERFGSLSDFFGPGGLNLVLAPPPPEHQSWISSIPPGMHNPQEVLDAGTALVTLLRGDPNTMSLNSEDLEPIIPIIDSILLSEDYVRSTALAEVSLDAYEASWQAIKRRLEGALNQNKPLLATAVEPGKEAAALIQLAAHFTAPEELNAPVVFQGDERTRADIKIEADRIPEEVKPLIVMGIARISAAMSADGKLFNSNFKGRHLVITTNVSITINRARLNELDPSGALAKLLPESIPLYRRTLDEGKFLPDGAADPKFANGGAYISNYSTFPAFDVELFKRGGMWGNGPSTGNWVPPYWSYDYERYPGGLRSPALFNLAWKGDDIPTLLDTLQNESWAEEEAARARAIADRSKVVEDKLIVEARKYACDQYRAITKPVPLQQFFLEKSTCQALYSPHYSEKLTRLASALVTNPKVFEELRGNRAPGAIQALAQDFSGDSKEKLDPEKQRAAMAQRQALLNLNLYAEGVQTALELNGLSGARLVETGFISWSHEPGAVAPFRLPVAQEVLREATSESELTERIAKVDAEIAKARAFVKRISAEGHQSASVQPVGDRGAILLVRMNDGAVWSPNGPKLSGDLGLLPRGRLFVELERLRTQLNHLIGNSRVAPQKIP